MDIEDKPGAAERFLTDTLDRSNVERFENREEGHAVSGADRCGKRRGFAVTEDQIDLRGGECQGRNQIGDRDIAIPGNR